MTRTGHFAGVAAIALALGCGVGRAQDLRAKVQGIVTDQSEAAVVGARVMLRNVNTGVESLRETNQLGQYVFDPVPPGLYSLAVEISGFAKFVQENILVQTRGDVTVNASLKVGTVAETVNVTEAPVSVSFNTSSLELTLDTKMANTLPIIHRNAFLLAAANPAVIVRSSTEQSPYHHWAASELEFGGNTNRKNDILVDGVPQLVGGKGVYVPNMDAVSEVTVLQNAVDAEFGHSAGGVVGVQMKSGTNQFHGTAYYFGRNPALNAVADSTTHRKNLVRNNVWGVSSGNPVLQNKVFNFFTYEAQDVREPRPLIATLPTDLERTGDFSQSFNVTGDLRQIYDPWTTRFNAATNSATRELFEGNRIPATRIDPTARRLLQDVWKPNNPGDDRARANNYREGFPQKFDYWNISNRTDWDISSKWKVFGRVSRFHTIQSDPNVTGSRAEPLAGSARHTTQAAGDVVWTVNPTTVFDIRGSYSKITDSYEAKSIQVERKFFEELWPGNPWYDLYLKELPALYYPGLSVRAESTATFGRDGFWFQEPRTWSLQSKISKQMGRHYLKVGGELRQLRVLAARPRPMGFTFFKDHTADTFLSPQTRLRGDAWATFLLGVVDERSRIQNIPLNKPRTEFWGGYVQNDIKLTQDLTLNLGLRWEYETSPEDPENRLSRFLDLTSPISEFQGAGAPALPAQVTALGRRQPIYNGAWVFTDGNNRGTWNSQLPLLLPRAGVAYRVNDRTALRFGYARYATVPVQERTALDTLGSMPYPGFDQTTNPLSVLEGVPRARLRDPHPARENPLVPPIGKSLGRYTGLGTELTWFHQSWHAGINDRFNVSLQRQMFSQMVVEATYFLNLGHDQPYNKLMNLIDPRFGFTHKALVTQRVNNPFFNILTPDKFPGQLRNQRQVTVESLLPPYPQYGRLDLRGIPGRQERYQALQLRAQRPFAGGFNFVLGYNYHRARDEAFYDDQDHFDNVFTFQPSNNPRHKVNLLGIYQFPVGRGRRLLSNAHKALDGVLGGWSVSAIYAFNSGEFVRFGALEQKSNPLLEDPPRDLRFNPAAFVRIQPFTRRSNPWQFPGVTGPHFSNLDMTLAKEFRLRERMAFELQMEAYNVSNSFMGAGPVTDVNSSLFGRVTQQKTGFSGRQLQYSGRFRW